MIMKAERQQKEATSRVIRPSKGHGGHIVDNRKFFAFQANLIDSVHKTSMIQPCLNNQNPIQRFVAITYAPNSASATVTYADLGTGSAPSVACNQIPSHAENLVPGITGADHPYHHERAHLIGRQLGGDGGDVNNLEGLSDGTNAPLMSDIEGTVYDMLLAAGPGSSVFIDITIDYTGTDYNGPPAAPYVAGMVGKLTYNVYDAPGGTLLFQGVYPNGVVKNHPSLGCC